MKWLLRITRPINWTLFKNKEEPKDEKLAVQRVRKEGVSFDSEGRCILPDGWRDGGPDDKVRGPGGPEQATGGTDAGGSSPA